MSILVIKSRFYNIGQDVLHQFEPTYMSYMINKIIDKTDMDVKCKSRTFEHTKHHLANKKYVVLIEGVEVTIKLTE